MLHPGGNMFSPSPRIELGEVLTASALKPLFLMD